VAINAATPGVSRAKVTADPEAARMEPSSAHATTEDATHPYLATLKSIPTIGLTKLVTLPKMTDCPKIREKVSQGK